MKKSKLKQIIKEVLLEDKGYSNWVPGNETPGLDRKTLESILLRIAKDDRPSEEEHSVARGNRILDKANPENIKKILAGEELGEIKVNDPTLNSKIIQAIKNYVETWEDEDMLNDVDEYFQNNDINKETFLDFIENYIDDISDLQYAKKAWKSIKNGYFDEEDLYENNSEIQRMQELAGLKQEIKVNNPNDKSFFFWFKEGKKGSKELEQAINILKNNNILFYKNDWRLDFNKNYNIEDLKELLFNNRITQYIIGNYK